nr:MAG TPA: hypothetical protein [Caudoviricetes sp.]
MSSIVLLYRFAISIKSIVYMLFSRFRVSADYIFILMR